MPCLDLFADVVRNEKPRVNKASSSFAHGLVRKMVYDLLVAKLRPQGDSRYCLGVADFIDLSVRHTGPSWMMSCRSRSLIFT
jgi:hypothetical protein